MSKQIIITIPIKERFEKFINKTTESGCWLWTGADNGYGYGAFALRKYHVVAAHRLSWELYVGPIPDNMDVLHKCDTPPCCNPLHLFLGTHKDNMQDATHKGRLPYGEKNHLSKLTEDKVKSIRKDTRSQADIAKEYCLHPSTVSYIKSGKTWKQSL
jgi:hypothetical protein